MILFSHIFMKVCQLKISFVSANLNSASLKFALALNSVKNNLKCEVHVHELLLRQMCLQRESLYKDEEINWCNEAQDLKFVQSLWF